MEDCVFCKIARGEIPCAKVHEDAEVLAFLDIIPDTPGHTLVIPKQHFENIFDIEGVVLEKVASVGKGLAIAMKEKLGAKGVHLANNSGAHASQIVHHFHLHIIPRYENDKFQMYGSRENKKTATTEELEEMAKKIR